MCPYTKLCKGILVYAKGYKSVQRMGNSMAEEQVFTVQELASYLRMKPVTIYKHAKAGKLPCFKVGANWRFKKSTIDRWISEQEEHETAGRTK